MVSTMLSIHIVNGVSEHQRRSVAMAIFNDLPPSKYLIFDGRVGMTLKELQEVDHIVVCTSIPAAKQIINYLSDRKVITYSDRMDNDKTWRMVSNVVAINGRVEPPKPKPEYVAPVIQRVTPAFHVVYKETGRIVNCWN